MKTLATLLLFVLSVMSASAADQAPRRPPPFPSTLGMLTSFIYTAQAYRAECAKHVTAKELHGSVGEWFERNQPLIEQVFAAGRKAKWFSADRSSEEVWAQMQRTDSEAIRAQIKGLIQSAPKTMCIDGMRPFKDGSYELENFPVHLKVLGVAVP